MKELLTSALTITSLNSVIWYSPKQRKWTTFKTKRNHNWIFILLFPKSFLWIMKSLWLWWWPLEPHTLVTCHVFHVTSNSCSWRCWAGPCPSAECPCCSQHWGPHPDSLTSFHKSCPLTSQTQPEKCNIVDISHRVKSFMIRNEWFREKYYRNSSELEIEPPIGLTSLIDDFNPNDQQQFPEKHRDMYLFLTLTLIFSLAEVSKNWRPRLSASCLPRS